MKKVLSLVLIIIIMTTMFVGCKSKEEETVNLNSLEKVKEAGVLRVGLDDSFPPMEYRDEENNLVGFDIDLANEIGEKLGVEVEFIPTEWNGILLALMSDKFDTIISTLSITEERKKSIDYSEPYIMEGIIAVTKSGNEDIKTIEDLKGKIVACQLGSTSESALNKLEGFKEVRKYSKVTEGFQDLEIGRIDAFVVDEIVGRYYISKKPDDFFIVPEKLQEEPVGMGFRKGDNELKDAIQKAYDELLEEGVLSELSIKWFGTDIYKK